MSRADSKHEVEAATRTLLMLNRQAEEARAELVGLRQNLMEVQRNLTEVRAAELREANEHLVLAALHAESIADKALSHLSEVMRVSQRDALTNTANRALMVDRLDNAVALARRHGTSFAVFFIDLDDFKQINDTLGHLAGDEVLQQAARHLQAAVRDSDTVSRYGGDEFLVLLADIAQSADAAKVAEKMLGALAEPIQANDHELHLSASIGIALYPKDADDALTLIGRADAAMYCSKRRRRGGFMSYDETCVGSDPGPPTVELMSRPAAHSVSTAIAHDRYLHDLREANENLVLAALTAQELEAQAKEAHSRQTAALAMVVHELRSPLTPIQTAAGMIRRSHPNEPLLSQLQVLIQGQVAHMARLVDDVLDGSRASTCKFQLERSTVQMGDILNLAVATCRPAIDAKSQRLKLQVPHRRLPEHGDPIRLAQVFTNLLTNASKYTPQGGRISLEAKVLEHSITITVTDSGIGITAEMLPHVFELFVRDRHAMAVDSRGLGIGLTVVRELVEAHGGTVIARSAGKNLGSQFVITLPMVGAHKNDPV
jgi:diguanylate cyclase (GGDEF)-like protein